MRRVWSRKRRGGKPNRDGNDREGDAVLIVVKEDAVWFKGIN